MDPSDLKPMSTTTSCAVMSMTWPFTIWPSVTTFRLWVYRSDKDADTDSSVIAMRFDSFCFPLWGSGTCGALVRLTACGASGELSFQLPPGAGHRRGDLLVAGARRHLPFLRRPVWFIQ